MFIRGIKERHALLWAVSTGDRADDRLRDVYIENGGLVVELFSPIDKRGDCCPVKFKRTRYGWREGKFRPDGKEELLSNPERSASLQFSPNRPPK